MIKQAILFLIITISILAGLFLAGCSIVGNEVSFVKQCTNINHSNKRTVKK